MQRLLPLLKAAEELELTEDELRAWIEAGKILAGITADGEILVSMDSLIKENPKNDINTQLEAIRRENFEHLSGKTIPISEAAKLYDVPGTTIRGWINAGYIQVLNPEGYPVHLNEAEIAYCVAIYRERKNLGIRAPLLDSQGKPYTLKRPELSKYRREKRQATLAT